MLAAVLASFCLAVAYGQARPGSPHKFADSVVRDVKTEAKKVGSAAIHLRNADGTTIAVPPPVDKTAKLRRLEVELREMLRIMRSWDPKQAEIPAADWWPKNISEKLEMSRHVKPEWRKSVIDDLAKKVAKVTRRASLSKTAKAA